MRHRPSWMSAAGIREFLADRRLDAESCFMEYFGQRRFLQHLCNRIVIVLARSSSSVCRKRDAVEEFEAENAILGGELLAVGFRSSSRSKMISPTQSGLRTTVHVDKEGENVPMKAIAVVVACVLLLCPWEGRAQTYPAKAVHIVVPFAAGGGVDITTRLIAEKLPWGNRVIVENRPGGGSVVGTEVVARSAPDGYTLLMTAPPFTTNAALVANLPYDSLRDFAPVTLAASAPLLVMVHPSLPARSIKELIEIAKARPGQLAYGSSGNGGPQHLGGELFKSMSNVDIVHVPYKGSAPAAADLVGGHVQLGFGDLLTVLPYVKAGRLRPLAVTGLQRSSIMPELPTVAESALPGFEAMTWYGLFARAGTPPAVIATINADFARALKLPEIKDRLAAEGTDVVGNDPATFGAFIQAEIEKVLRLSKIASIRIE